MKLKKPKVYFIGASYFDYDFISIKSHRALMETDILVYDDTINQNFITNIPFKMKKININNIKNFKYENYMAYFLYYLVSQGNVVTRLTQGDFFYIGNGFRELNFLKNNKIDFEIVPALSLESSISLYTSIPFSYNEDKQNLLIVSCSDVIDYETIAKFKGTIILKNFFFDYNNILNTLFFYGMKKDKKVCLVEFYNNGFHRKFNQNISLIPKLIEEKNIDNGFLIIGDICFNNKSFDLSYLKPLKNIKILIPKLKGSSNSISYALRNKGAYVNELICFKYYALDFEINLKMSEWLIFTSDISVNMFFSKIRSMGQDARSFKDKKFAAIDSKTEKELDKNGILCDFLSSKVDGFSMIDEFKDRGFLHNKSLITVFRGNGLALDLINKLENEKIDYHDVLLYNSELISNCIDDIKTYKYIIFYNVNSFKSFLSCLDCDKDYSWINAICFGNTTAVMARQYNMKAYVCESPDTDSIVNQILLLEKNNIKLIDM